MLDGRFDQHFLEVFAGHAAEETDNPRQGSAPAAWPLRLALLLAMVALPLCVTGLR